MGQIECSHLYSEVFLLREVAIALHIPFTYFTVLFPVSGNSIRSDCKIRLIAFKAENFPVNWRNFPAELSRILGVLSIGHPPLIRPLSDSEESRAVE